MRESFTKGLGFFSGVIVFVKILLELRLFDRSGVLLNILDLTLVLKGLGLGEASGV